MSALIDNDVTFQFYFLHLVYAFFFTRRPPPPLSLPSPSIVLLRPPSKRFPPPHELFHRRLSERRNRVEEKLNLCNLKGIVQGGYKFPRWFCVRSLSQIKVLTLSILIVLSS